MAGLGNQIVKTVTVRGVKVDGVGCWDSDTPESEYDFYDFYVLGECINLGEPHYDKEKGLVEAIEACLENYVVSRDGSGAVAMIQTKLKI